jgi:hypothetical protein
LTFRAWLLARHMAASLGTGTAELLLSYHALPSTNDSWLMLTPSLIATDP